MEQRKELNIKGNTDLNNFTNYPCMSTRFRLYSLTDGSSDKQSNMKIGLIIVNEVQFSGDFFPNTVSESLIL